jgi:hypothetical protein
MKYFVLKNVVTTASPGCSSIQRYQHINVTCKQKTTERGFVPTAKLQKTMREKKR